MVVVVVVVGGCVEVQSRGRGMLGYGVLGSLYAKTDVFHVENLLRQANL